MMKQTDDMDITTETQDSHSKNNGAHDHKLFANDMPSSETMDSTESEKTVQNANNDIVALNLPENLNKILEGFLPNNFQVNQETIFEELMKLEGYNDDRESQLKAKYDEVVENLHLLITKFILNSFQDRFEHMLNNLKSELDQARQSANELKHVQLQAREYAERISRMAN